MNKVIESVGNLRNKKYRKVVGIGRLMPDYYLDFAASPNGKLAFNAGRLR